MVSDPTHESQIEQLRVLMLRRWWKISGILWVIVGIPSLWAFRDEFTMLGHFFTWAALRYALAYNRLAAFGFALCLGLTVALLVGESRHILFGLAHGERKRLERQLKIISQTGPRHPLWKQVVGQNHHFD